MNLKVESYVSVIYASEVSISEKSQVILRTKIYTHFIATNITYTQKLNLTHKTLTHYFLQFTLLQLLKFHPLK